MDKNNFKCICCESNDYSILDYNNYGYKILEIKGNNIFHNLSIYLCKECGFSNAFPIIKEKELNEFYNLNYSATDTMHSVTWEEKFRNYKKYFAWRYLSQIYLVKTFKDILSIHNVLEIGPGNCEGKRTFDRMNCDVNYYVFEEDYSKYELIKKNKIQLLEKQKDHFFIEKYANKFDLTIMSHSLEHFQFHQIIEILNSIYKMTKNRGVFLIEVPCDDFRFDEVRVNHSPHLCFFTVQSFQKIIKKTKFRIIFLNEYGGIKNNRPYEEVYPSSLKNKLKSIKSLLRAVRLLKSLKNLIKIILKKYLLSFLF